MNLDSPRAAAAYYDEAREWVETNGFNFEAFNEAEAALVAAVEEAQK